VKKQTMNILAVMLLSVMASLMASAQAPSQNLPQAPHTFKLESLRPGNGAVLSTDDGIQLPLTVGWNYVHPQNCAAYYSGGYTYLYVYSKEGPYFWTTNFQIQSLLDPACQTGNWVAFYVTNTNGTWSEAYTYTYK